ncbi:TPA: gp58-like family protein, partial [Streptococcus suis]
LDAVNNRGVVQFTTTFKVNVPRSQIGDLYFHVFTRDFTGEVEFEKVSLRRGNIDLGWQPSPEDLRSEIATYKRSAEESSAELSRQIQLADGKAVEAKTYAQQTADVIKTRLESLEIYKNAEGARAEQYLTASRTETAKQIAAERTAIASNYVAKSTYDENVRGTTLKLNEIKTTADTAKQNLATYQNTVDRKLTELTTSTQTLDGKINTASAKVDTVAGQIRTEIGEVEGKIPTEIGGRNYLRNSRKIIRSQQRFIEVLTWEVLAGLVGKTVTFSFDIKINPGGVSRPISVYRYQNNGISPALSSTVTPTSEWQRFSLSGIVKSDIVNSTYTKGGIGFYDWAGNNDYSIQLLKIELGTIATDWTPAPEDFDTEISSVKTTITQTASGVEQLSTSLSATNTKVTTAETNIRQLVNDVSSKVSQSDYNTLTGRMTSAETAITQNAQEISRRLTSTQVESAITGKGYQTKADVDSNITGRGYITSSALQPYALSTTVQNLVQETATNFSRTISRVENKIPTKIGVTNLLEGTSSDWKTIRVTQHNGLIKSYNPQEWALLNIKTGDSVTFSVDVKTTSGKKLRSRISFYGPNTHYYSETFVVNGEGRLSVTGIVPDGITSVQLFVDANLTAATNTGVTDESRRREKLEIGAIPTDWSPAPEELATVTALHDVKDTVSSHTRTIGAVGTAGSILDNISKVTQTAAGLVQEVSGANGLKTQVSTLAGSYAIKNLTSSGKVLNQLNLNKDGSVKIDGSLVQITGRTYIQDGVITSAKIAGLDAGKVTTGYLASARIKANSIDGSKIAFDEAFFNGLVANQAYLKKLFAKDAFLTAVQAVTLSASKITGGLLRATNGAMVIDLDNALTEYKERATIRFHSAGNVLYREKRHPRGHNTIGALMFKDSNGGGVMTAIGNTSHQTIDTMRNNYGEGGLTGSFAGIRVVRDDADTNRDRVDIIADRIIMAHSTNFQAPTNSGFYFYPTAVRGWWNLGAILQHISNKFKEHGWGGIGDIYHLGYAAETTPSQYT